MDLSSRYLPDLSDDYNASGIPDNSFQIPVASGSSSNDMLLADDSVDFFRNLKDVASPLKPAPLLNHRPLTLEELTPRSKPFRSVAASRPETKPHMRLRPTIPSPLKKVVAHDLSTALEEALSPLRNKDVSFAIPSGPSGSGNMLLTDESLDFKMSDADITINDSPARNRDPLTLSQLTPAVKKVQRQTPGQLVEKISSAVSDLPRSDTSNSGSSDSTVGTKMELPPAAATFESVVDLSTPQDSELDLANINRDRLPSPLAETPKSSVGNPIIPDVGVRGSSSINVPEHSSATCASRKPDNSKGARDKSRTKSKPTVIAGGITKVTKQTKKTLPISSNFRRDLTAVAKTNGAAHSRIPHGQDKTLTKGALPESSSSQMSVDLELKSCEDLATGQSHPSGGLAATLMAYAQQASSSSSTALQVQPTTRERKRCSEVVPEQVEIAQSIPEDGSLADTSREDPLCAPLEIIEESSHESHSKFPPVISSTALSTSDPIADSDLRSQRVQGSPKISPIVPDASTDPATSVMPLSPMRTSVKRSSSPAPSEQRQRKKTKGPSGDSKPGNELSHVARDPIGPKGKALQPSRVKNTSGHSTFTSKSSQRGLAKSRSKPFKSSDNNELKSSEVQHKRSRSRTDTAASSANAELNGGNQLISSGSSIVNGTSEEFTFSSAAGRSGDQHRDHGYLVPDRGFKGLKDSNTSSSNAAGNSRPSGRTQHNERSTSTLPPAKPTRPIEFNFHLDARIEARKAELALGSNSTSSSKTLNTSKKGYGVTSSSSSTSSSLGSSSTSNSKSTHTRVHSAQEQEQILAIKRKEHITPIIPIGFNFSTDIRAVEREKFELARREREREAERLIEEKKRLQELEDEREIKELRKRAVPKANEIPEWYAFAPKRSHKAS